MEALYMSYSPEDGQFAGKLANALANVGFNLVPRNDYTDTEMFSKCLDEALKVYDTLLLLWSKTARTNRFVERDWTSALVFDKKIVSIVLDDTAVPAALLKGKLVDFRSSSRDWLQMLAALQNDPSVAAKNGAHTTAHTVNVVEMEAQPLCLSGHNGEARHRNGAVHLRADRSLSFTIENVEAMLKKWNYFDKTWQRTGCGVPHQYEAMKPFGDPVVFDHATGLCWQRAGSDNWKLFPDALKYIDHLNDTYFAGYSDWRLPTLEEAMSLVEPELFSNRMHISTFFSPEQRYIWTADKLCEQVVWFVAFPNGGIGSCRPSNFNSVRAVRNDW